MSSKHHVSAEIHSFRHCCMGEAWGCTSASTQNTVPPGFVSLGYAVVTAKTTLVSGYYPVGRCHGVTIGPYNGQSSAGGPRQIHSKTDSGTFVEGNPSRTAPTSFCGACTISSCHATRLCGKVRSAQTCPAGLWSRLPPQYPLYVNSPPAPPSPN